MKFILSVSLLGLMTSGLTADAPKVLRKPAATYSLDKPAGTDNGIYAVGLSPDGKLVACVRGGQLSVYEAGQAKPLFVTRPDTVARATMGGGVVFSADGKLVAFAGKDKPVVILSARTGAAHSSIELPVENPGDVQTLAFSPDGRRLAVSSGYLYHMDVLVFDTTSGKLLGTPLVDLGGLAYQLLYSPDGKRLVANFYRNVYTVDAATHRLAATAKGTARAVFFQGDKLSVVHEEGGVREVTAAGIGKEDIGRFAEKLGGFDAARMVVAGRPAVAAIPEGNQIAVRDLKGRERFRVIGEDKPIRRISLSADGRVMLVHRDDTRVELFRLE